MARRNFIKYLKKDFPGGPVARTLSSQHKGTGFDHWSGDWIPHAPLRSITAKKIIF